MNSYVVTIRATIVRSLSVEGDTLEEAVEKAHSIFSYHGDNCDLPDCMVCSRENDDLRQETLAATLTEEDGVPYVEDLQRNSATNG